MKKTILIVDDEKDLRTVLANMLEKITDKVYLAENGKEALKRLEQHPDILCVVSDIRMPVMDGIGLIKEVRRQGNEVPFIFFTAFGERKLMLEVAKHGAFDFIEKPDLHNLGEVVNRGLQAGFKRKTASNLDQKEVLREYEKLLQETEKNS